MTAPTPVLDPSEHPGRPSRRELRRGRRRGRRATGLFLSSLILLVVAIGTTGAALVVRHDTSNVRARAELVRADVRALAATEADAARRLRFLRARARRVNDALAALFGAELAQVDASDHAVDVANQAVDRYNNAQTTDLVAAFRAAGDAGLADLEAKTAAVLSAADATRRAVADLQTVAGD